MVTTLYNSARHLREFCRRMIAAARQISDRFELVLVDDGSPDESLTIARELGHGDPRIKIVELSRNFGHHKALMTGLAFAAGERVFLIDSDLEESPELLLEFGSRMAETRADVVFGVQEQRSGSPFKRLSGEVAYQVINRLLDFPLPRNVCTVRLMTRDYVDALLDCTEREPVIAGLWQYVGFRQVAQVIEKAAKSRSDYTIARRIALTARWVTGFSSIPLVLIAYIGAFILAVSSAYSLYLIAVRLFLGSPPAGYTSLLVSLWFLGGLIVFCLGVVAIYLSVIFAEVKRRPYTIVRAIHQQAAGAVYHKEAA